MEVRDQDSPLTGETEGHLGLGERVRRAVGESCTKLMRRHNPSPEDRWRAKVAQLEYKLKTHRCIRVPSAEGALSHPGNVKPGKFYPADTPPESN